MKAPRSGCCPALACLAGLLGSAAPAQAQTADTAFVNGRIYTVDPGRPWVEAVAIEDSRFLAVGSDAEIEAMIDSGTTVVDLGGRMAMPGIHDMHMHPVSAAMTEIFECNFADTLTLEGVARKVEECTAERPPGTWVRGGAYGVQLLQADVRPHKSLLDAAAPEHPVYLRSSGGHSGWANSRALELAGIDRESADPEKGEIVRDPDTGEPTGLLFESANGLIRRVLPDYTPEQYRRAVQRISSDFNRLGIIAIKDAATSPEVAAAYSESDRADELTLRVATSLGWGEDAPARGEIPRAVLERDRYRSERVYPDFVKIFVDGSAGARKAAYLEPYQPHETHADDYRGEFMTPPERLKDYLIQLDRMGVTVKMHCGGDAAVRAALDAIQAAREANGDSGLLHEVAHANLVAPEDIPRFRELNAVAELSPVYYYPGRLVELLTITLGPERVARIWPIKSFVDAGAHTVYGSDWPAVVPSASPWRSLEAITTRRDPEGRTPGYFNREQAIDLATAIGIFTLNGAYTMGLERLTGSIAVEKLADMIVLDQNLFEIPPEQIGDTKVLLTLLEGKVVHESDQFSIP